MTQRLRIVAIGQLPPPVSGFSYITASMIEILKAGNDVITCNIAAASWARGSIRHATRLWRTFAACGQLLRSARHPERTCYIACEGGLGLVYTLIVLLTARMTGYTTLLHHHSFSYIDKRRGLMRSLILVGGDVTHIFLCSTMRDRFEATYSSVVRSTILSNAAFVPRQLEADQPRERSAMIVGHLSNLTREKGLYLFLDLMRAVISAGLNVRGILAGPVALEDDRKAIASAVAASAGRLEYRGPLYGLEKEDFYRDVDVFIFPTQYVNEAQPTVVFEALSFGKAVVSYDRGCIANQVGAHGLLLARNEDFVARTLEWLADMTKGEDRRSDWREAIQRSFIEHRKEALLVAAALIKRSSVEQGIPRGKDT